MNSQRPDVKRGEQTGCRRCGAPATCRISWGAPEALRVLGPPEVAGVGGPWCSECGRTIADELDARVRRLINGFREPAVSERVVALEALEAPSAA